MSFKIIYDCFDSNQRRFLKINMFCEDGIDGSNRMNILKNMKMISSFSLNERWTF